MASTFVDSYTFLDTVNENIPASTQYTSNEGDATLTVDSYIPTSSSNPIIPSALRLLSPGALLDDGLSQKALYELLLMISVNWDEAMKALDDESLTKSDYEALAAIGPLDGDYTSAFTGSTIGLKVIGGQEAKVNISPEGISTRDLAVFLQAIATQFAACTANLDADGTLTDINYASTLDIDFTAKTGWFPPLASTDPFDISGQDATQSNPASKIKVTGIRKEALIDYLNTVITQMNLLWVKLDADI